jgi:hypothetical protein
VSSKIGFVRRRTLALLAHRGEAISVDQSVAGVIFGFGALMLTAVGGVKELFFTMPRHRWSFVNVSRAVHRKRLSDARVAR